ncbi:hypothetical protein A33Q_4124 [Indibacter alkaliphilus LW1]|uniref:Uncharacterized protein n=1 Tax=Indibacter alkaliphilus (strain CCUG 57479 / KCTC 22604 / LW1) TaxID=1189612 RepID=S2DJA3_INDAL|nr:hypothetical protein [Indibacter alkaliphilus]EOZ92031.1 hypothetical protein A33Q_4124 [Indibacter alkaliphilus LW1]
MKNLKIFGLILLTFIYFQSCQNDTDPDIDFSRPLEIVNLEYGSEPRQVMDVFLPAGRSSTSTKVLVWIHHP